MNARGVVLQKGNTVRPAPHRSPRAAVVSVTLPDPDVLAALARPGSLRTVIRGGVPQT